MSPSKFTRRSNLKNKSNSNKNSNQNQILNSNKGLVINASLELNNSLLEELFFSPLSKELLEYHIFCLTCVRSMKAISVDIIKEHLIINNITPPMELSDGEFYCLQCINNPGHVSFIYKKNLIEKVDQLEETNRLWSDYRIGMNNSNQLEIHQIQ